MSTETEAVEGSRRRWPALVGAVLWLVQPVYLLVELVTLSQVEAPYSILDNTISDAGAVTCTTMPYAWGPVPVCSPLGWLLNAATALFGLAFAVGAVLLHRSLPPGRARGPLLVMAVLSGLSLVGTGLVPLDVDVTLHVMVALPQFVTFPAFLFLVALVLRRVSRWAARLAAGAAAVTFVGVLVFVVRAAEPSLGGLFERLALWPLYVVLAPIGLLLVDRCRRQGAEAWREAV